MPYDLAVTRGRRQHRQPVGAESLIRHIAEQEALLAQHQSLIHRLRDAVQPDDLTLEVLTTMEKTLEVFRHHTRKVSSLAAKPSGQPTDAVSPRALNGCTFEYRWSGIFQ